MSATIQLSSCVYSLGGAVAAHASTPENIPTQIGFVVIDVVEG